MTITAHVWTADEITQGKSFLDEGRLLLAGGDIDLATYRIFFQQAVGRPTTVDNDALLTVIGLDSEGDYCPMIETNINITDDITEWFVSRVLGIENTTTLAAKNDVTGLSLVVVQENVDGYDYGSELKSTADIARYLRLVFNTAQKAGDLPEWKYADDVIVDIVRRTPHLPSIDDEEYEDAIIDAMSEFAPETLPDVRAMDRIDESAHSFEALADKAAAILGADSELTDILVNLDVARKTEYMGPIVVYQRLEKLIENDPELLGLLPEPGTTKEIVAGTNEPYDKYPQTVISTSGTRRVKTMSRIDEIVFRLPIVRNARNQANTHKENIVAKRAEAMNRSDKAALDTTATIIKRHVRQAVALVHRFRQCDDLPLLSVKLFKNLKGETKTHTQTAFSDTQMTGNLRVTPKPVSIYERENPVEKQGAFSVVQFIAMRPRVALQNGGTFDALIASVESKNGGTPEGEPMPKNIEELRTKLNYFATVISDAKFFAMLRDSVLKPEGAEDISSLDIIQQRAELLLNLKQASAPSQRAKLTEGAAKAGSGSK